jgi:hypothetical protein
MTIATNEHNGWETTGKHRKILWRKKHNSLREMWWDPFLGPFYLPYYREVWTFWPIFV